MQRICSKQRLDELRTSSRDSLPYPVENEPPLVQKCRDPGYTGGELNLQPSLWFMAAICCFSASATAFLETYVLSASGHLAVFLVGGYVVFSSYFVCDYVMMRVSTSYAAIPDAKKFYVLSNLVKAAVLLSYTPVAARTLYLGMVNDEWSTTSIRNLGVLYAIPDTVSLLLVERMALTTRIHHLCVIVFMVRFSRALPRPSPLPHPSPPPTSGLASSFAARASSSPHDPHPLAPVPPLFFLR